VIYCPHCGREVKVADYIDKKINIDKAIAKEYEVWHPPLETTEESRKIDFSGSSDWPFYEIKYSI